MHQHVAEFVGEREAVIVDVAGPPLCSDYYGPTSDDGREGVNTFYVVEMGVGHNDPINLSGGYEVPERSSRLAPMRTKGSRRLKRRCSSWLVDLDLFNDHVLYSAAAITALLQTHRGGPGVAELTGPHFDDLRVGADGIEITERITTVKWFGPNELNRRSRR